MLGNWSSLRELKLFDHQLRAICACALAAIACATQAPRDFRSISAPTISVPDQDTVTRPVEIFSNSRSQLGAIRTVIQTQAEYSRIWETLRRNVSESPPQVDFSKDMVIVAGMGFEPEVGRWLRITSVLDTALVLDITVDLAISTATCNKPGYPLIEHPAVMVRVPRSRSTPVFRDRLRRSC
jgi:hypothetical protein